MSPGRERGLALGCLVVGAAVMLLAASRVWIRGVTIEEGLPALPLSLTGRESAASVSAIALLALTGAALVLLVGGVLRRVVGAVLLVAGLAAASTCVRAVIGNADVVDDALDALRDTTASSATGISTSAWPWVAFAGALLVAFGGTVIAVRAGRWPSRAARYESGPTPTAGAGDPTDRPVDQTSDELWKALDRGEDPTA